MGILGFGGKSKAARPFDRFEALSGVLLALIARDGEITSDEEALFRYVIIRHRLFLDQSADDYEAMRNMQGEFLSEHDWFELLNKSLDDLPDEFYPTTFVLAVDFILADGEVSAEKERIIEMLRDKLSIEEEFANSAVLVTAAKYAVGFE